jgi:OmpA-OmpF porin, OOP family
MNLLKGKPMRLGKHSLTLTAAVFGASLAAPSAAAEVITIDGGSAPGHGESPFTCSQAGDNEIWLPAMGFVYRNVEAFELSPGDTISFDIQMGAVSNLDPDTLGYMPQLDIALAHAPDPAQPFVPKDLPGSDFVVVANDASPSSPGNRTSQDYELTYTVDQAFSFPGGGLIIRFTEPKGELASRGPNQCTYAISADRQPAPLDTSNRLVGTFLRDADGEYPWSTQVVVDPRVAYVRIAWTRCGDGQVTGGEACDDANTDNTDDCSNRCAVAACGDGIVQVVEQCDNSVDPSNPDPFCNERCLLGAVAKGSGCSTGAGAGAGLGLALLLLAFTFRRKSSRQTGAAGAMLLVAVTWAGSAEAQMATDGFRVDRFEMAPSVEDGLVIQDPRVLAHKVWSMSATLGFTNTVLRVVPTEDANEGVDVVGPRLSAYLDFAIGLRDRFEVNVSLPFAVAQASESGMAAGYTLQDASTTAIGDGRLGGSVLLYGKKKVGPQVGLAAALTVPIGSERSFTGDGGVGGEAQLMGGFVQPKYRIVLNGGVRLRPEADYVTSDQGTELIGRAGVLVPFADDRLTTSLEFDVIGRLGGDDPSRELGVPVLALLGARYHFVGGMRAGAGIGMGLTEAPGSPAVRALLTVGYSPEPKPPEKPRRPELDRDGDRIIDRLDRCPAIPEDYDGVDDEDGCPDPMPPAPATPPEPERPLTLEDVITLPAPIEFEFDTAIMLPGAEVYLTQVLGVLNNHPEVLKIEIQGHTSSEGGPEYNLRLSNARATAVFNWLVERGVDRKRLVARGYGLTQPIMPNDSEQNRQKNRRVQFRMMQKQEPVPATPAPATPAPAATAPAPAPTPATPASATPPAPATTAPVSPPAPAPATTPAAKPAAPATTPTAKPAAPATTPTR